MSALKRRGTKSTGSEVGASARAWVQIMAPYAALLVSAFAAQQSGQMKQENKIVAGSVATIVDDQNDNTAAISRLNKEVFGKKIDPRLTRLERPTGRATLTGRRFVTARSDSSARSPGPGEVLKMAVTAPFKAGWGLLKKMIGQGGQDEHN